jgi:hypothetical protein
MDVLFAVQSHLKPPSKPEASSHRYPDPEARVPAERLPYIVRAVAQKDLSRPDDGFAAPSDAQAELLGNINRIYGVPRRTEPARKYGGSYGFIVD